MKRLVEGRWSQLKGVISSARCDVSSYFVADERSLTRIMIHRRHLNTVLPHKPLPPGQLHVTSANI